MQLNKAFSHAANTVATAAGRPTTFVLCVATIVVWGITGPIFGFSDTWQLVINTGTTIITFLMVFLIQNTQNRETSAMQAKLDEIILALRGAQNRMIGIEHLTDRELEMIVSESEARAKIPPAQRNPKTGERVKAAPKRKGRAPVRTRKERTARKAADS